MNDNYPLGADLDSNAPWNQETLYCPECGSDQLEITDSGLYKRVKWYEYTCLECGIVISNEPDYE
jgi:uncharacterized Zn finger protein